MKLTKRQKQIIFGLILGDAYLQKTGKKNARLRLEHSSKQTAYIDWKYEELFNIFGSKPKKISRLHPISKKLYSYLRLQSNSSPILGRIAEQFYDGLGKKKLPGNLEQILQNPLTIAVWYMDDGYYYKRDKSVHIYTQKFSDEDMQRLVDTFYIGHKIRCKWYCRPDRNGCQLNFTGEDKDKFFKLIHPHLIKPMRYKISLDPVTTEDEN